MNERPLGIMPQRIWKEKRFDELGEAILRYVREEFPIDPQWIEEWNNLIKELK